MTTIKATFSLGVLMCVGYALWLAADTLQWFVEQLLSLAMLSMRVCGGLVVLLVVAAVIYIFRRQRHEHNRQRDGAFALREYWLEPLPKRIANWLMGRPSARIVYDPNANISHAAVVHDAVFCVEPAAGWDRQLAYAANIESTRRAQAIAPGDGVLGLPWFGGGGGRSGIANAATGRLLSGAYDKPPKSPPTIDAPMQLPALPPPPLTVQDAVAQSQPAALVLGQTDGGDLVRWDMVRVPHFRVHGTSQGAGKTNATQVLAAAALKTGAHVVVFDPAHFKDWAAFAHCAELVDASDPAALADGATRLLTIYHNRTQQLAEAGVRNIGEMQRAPRRIVVIICEFGAQCEMARAEGIMGDVEVPLLQLARKAAATGIHLAIEDQAMEHWPRALSANIAGVAIGRMPLYDAQACGFIPRRGATTETLDRGQFWFGGQLVCVPHAGPELRSLLADVPAPRQLVILTPPWRGESSARSVAAGAGESPEVGATEHATERTPERIQPNTAPEGPTDLQAAVWEWRDAHPTGTQAELRRDFEARGIDIARGYAHECWHKWPGPTNRLDLTTEEGRAAFAAMAASARLPGGDKLGTDTTSIPGGSKAMTEGGRHDLIYS